MLEQAVDRAGRDKADGAAPERRIVAPDPRAEGARRLVWCRESSVTIMRRLSGIRMRIRVPSRLYRGVVLERVEASESVFQLRLHHEDAELSIVLDDRLAADDSVAQWTAWANFFALPRLLKTTDGALLPFDEKLGKVALGDQNATRRRGSATRWRRTRFQARRKMGCESREPPTIL